MTGSSAARSALRIVPRPGFSLTELLVTIVIISIMSSLVLSGLIVARDSQRAAKTSSTIRKLNEVILPYYESYENRRPTTPSLPSSAATADFQELRRIALRRLMAMELPDRPSDIPDYPASNGSFSIANIGDVSILGGDAAGSSLSEVPPCSRRYDALIPLDTTISPPRRIKVASSELLHMIVMRGPVADPNVTAHFRDDEIDDTNGNGLREFVDGWGRPIRFVRWPVGFSSPVQPIEGTTKELDTVVSAKGHRLVPLIYSAGKDGAYDILRGFYYDANYSSNGIIHGLNYAMNNFDPFAYAVGTAADPDNGRINYFRAQSTKNAVNLTAVSVAVRPGDAGGMVFRAERYRTAPPSANSFQAIGSERDTNGPSALDDESTGNGVVESIDNIHNHNLTR